MISDKALAEEKAKQGAKHRRRQVRAGVKVQRGGFRAALTEGGFVAAWRLAVCVSAVEAPVSEPFVSRSC